MNATLGRQVRMLLTRYGREQVLEALANAEAVQLPQRRRIAAARSRPKTAPLRRRRRPRKSPLEVVEAAQVDPDIRPVMERIALAYEAKEILPEPWRVKDFLESEGIDRAKVRSRADALPKFVATLAGRRREELEELFEGWRKHVEIGDLGMIAEAILGPHKTVASPGER